MIRTRLLEALESLQEALSRTDRIDAIAVRLDAVERRIDTVERRLPGLTDLIGQVANLRSDLEAIDTRVGSLRREVVVMRDTMAPTTIADDAVADLWTYARESRTLIDQQRPLAMGPPNNGPTVRRILEDG